MKTFHIANLAVLFSLLATPALADAPVAYQIFCIRFGGCEVGGPASVPYTQKLAQDLAKVTRSVNRSIAYRPDKGEVWKTGVSAGDCEDYALTKRYRLKRLGYPPSALRMAVGYTREGEYHAVLIVVTSRGKFVLDNLTDEVLLIGDANLKISKMASADPKVWR